MPCACLLTSALLKPQGCHHGDVDKPQGIELMREGEDHMRSVTRQELRPLQGQPAFSLEIRAWGTGAMPARIVPDTGDVAVVARLDMATERGGPTLHEGMRGSAHVGRQGMAL